MAKRKKSTQGNQATKKGKVDSIHHPSIKSDEYAILRELGITDGPNFRSLLKILRWRLDAGYNNREATISLRCTEQYINRCSMLAPAHQRSALLENMRRYAQTIQKNHEKVFAEYLSFQRQREAKEKAERTIRLRRQRIRSRINSCKTREDRLTVFGRISTHDPLFNSDLFLHLHYITTRKEVEHNLRINQERQKIRNSLIESGRRLTARVIVPDDEKPDDEAPLPVLVRRYIHGSRSAEFRLHARLCAGMSPLEVIESFLGHKVGQQDEQEAPPAPIIDEVKPEQPEPLTVAPVAVAVAVALPPKREGREVTTTSRPDQAPFSDAVRLNCFDSCVISGVNVRYRTEAAHLVEHRRGGVDHYSNGLLLRIDLHRLFDENLIAINPVTLTVNVAAWVREEDPDLEQYHGQQLKPTRKPINNAFLVKRWELFQQLAGDVEQPA